MRALQSAAQPEILLCQMLLGLSLSQIPSDQSSPAQPCQGTGASSLATPPLKLKLIPSQCFSPFWPASFVFHILTPKCQLPGLEASRSPCPQTQRQHPQETRHHRNTGHFGVPEGQRGRTHPEGGMEWGQEAGKRAEVTSLPLS